MQQRVLAADANQVGRAAPSLRLKVTLKNGAQFSPRARAGARIMDAIRADGFPIKGGCRGQCVCSNCHIKVSRPWRSLLPPPSEAEREALRDVAGADERSRLACQLLMTADLDGLAIELQPESIALQTYWVAG